MSSKVTNIKIAGSNPTHNTVTSDETHTVKQRKKVLTPKKLHFCRCVVHGMSLTDAYRESYSTKNMMRKTIAESASRLNKEPLVTARIEQLISLKEQALTRSTIGLKSKVLDKLVSLMEVGTPQDSSKIRAAELLGKTLGLFKEVIEDNRETNQTPEQLTALLQAKLEQLGSKTSH